MPVDLNAILRMRKPKGRHIGAAMLLNLVHDYTNAGVPHDPIFSQEKLSKMVSSLSSDTELGVYANYADIIAGAEHLFDYTEYCVHQVMHGFYRLSTITSELSIGLKLRFAAERTGLDPASLESFFSLVRSPSEILSDSSERKFLSLSYHGLIFRGLRGMLAFDAFMSTISEVSGVPEVSEIKSSSDDVLKTIALLNNIVGGAFPDDEKKSFNILFPPVNVGLLSPSEEKRLELKKKLSDINSKRCPSLKKLKPLMLSLCGEGETS